MKKRGLFIIIVLLISGSLLFYSGPLDKWRVRGVTKGIEKAIEQEDSGKIMSRISLKYTDDYGYNYSMVKQLLTDLFQDFDEFDVTIQNPVIETRDDTATVKFDVWVSVDWNGNPSYIVGTNRSSAHISVFLAKEFLSWKVVRVEGVK